MSGWVVGANAGVRGVEAKEKKRRVALPPAAERANLLPPLGGLGGWGAAAERSGAQEKKRGTSNRYERRESLFYGGKNSPTDIEVRESLLFSFQTPSSYD